MHVEHGLGVNHHRGDGFQGITDKLMSCQGRKDNNQNYFDFSYVVYGKLLMLSGGGYDFLL